MANLDVNGIRLYHEEHGEGASILVIHGTGSSALVWSDAIGGLSKLGRVIAYDRRGCSRTELPQPYPTTTVREHTEDAAALLDAVDASPAIVIGRSYGGGVALDLAMRYPDHVRALVLLEAAVIGLSPGFDRWLRELYGRVEASGVRGAAEAMFESLSEGMWNTLPEELRQLFAGNGAAILAECAGGDLTSDPDTLSTIERPTLVVGAADSPSEFSEMTDRLAAAIQRSKRVQVEGGHLVDPTHPEVIGFVRNVLTASA